MKRIKGSTLQDGVHHKHHHACHSRREFLSRMGLFATGSALMLNGAPVQALASSGFFKRLAGLENNRILVLIQLDGGNDGLNTVIPIENDEYYRLRPSIGIPKNDAIRLTDTLGLNPHLQPLYPLWEQGKMGVIQGVGYENADLSHFRSMDIWQSGSDSDEFLTTGWLGRFLDEKNPNFLDQPPEDPLAIQIGGASSMLFAADEAGMGMNLPDLSQLERLVDQGLVYSMDGIPNSLAGEEIRFLRHQANNSYRYADTIKKAYDASANKSDYSADLNGQLNRSLSIIARLIKGNMKTQIYLVTLGGFDTHAFQTDEHPNLMRDLGNAVSAFYDDLSADGYSQNVLISTFSEFGRRVFQNQSNGTDHGTSAPMFVFGDAIEGGVFGSDPKLLDHELDEFGNMIHEYEFRQIYASILDDWFGLGEATTQEVLGGTFTKIDFVGDKLTSTSRSNVPSQFVLRQNYPNPFNPSTQISFELATAAQVRLQVFDMQGRRVSELVNRSLPAGSHTVSFDGGRLPSGTYLYRLQAGSFTQTRPMTLIK